MIKSRFDFGDLDLFFKVSMGLTAKFEPEGAYVHIIMNQLADFN